MAVKKALLPPGKVRRRGERKGEQAVSKAIKESQKREEPETDGNSGFFGPPNILERSLKVF